jgi:hypothetical protein
VSNHFNAEGQLSAWAVTPTFDPAVIPGTDYYATTKRAVSLPRGEWKYLETSLFLPRRPGRGNSAIVNYQVDRGRGGIPLISLAAGTPVMGPHQYHFVLLSERPETYNFLNFTDCYQLRMRSDNIFSSRMDFYLLVPTLPNEPLPLPRQSLNWTTIGYLLWDDLDPNQLSQDHQTALLDWLHFGGQLILSGPDCLEKLENSFLGNYLPARLEESLNLNGDLIAELKREWSVPVPRRFNPQKRKPLTLAGDALRGVRFQPHPEGQFVSGTGELVIERQIGRGRIVATAFPINAPGIRGWSSFPSFLNSVLLRRPGRQFFSQFGDISFRWINDGTSIIDPLLGSTLRFISRDLAIAGTGGHPPVSEQEQDGNDYLPPWNSPIPLAEEPADRPSNQRNLDLHRYYGGFQNTTDAGVAGWNDYGAISNAARETLVESAGIIPPSSGFVLKMLAGYLLVLVPLNWLVFRSLGHVEWAWIAVPLIAILGALTVVKLASLDIGFVRSNTQVGFVEAWENYPRAHVSEYSALYTSLSTRYQALLDNNSAQALPFAGKPETLPTDRKIRPVSVTLKRGVASELEGLQIQSNSTGLLHTELMLELDGCWKKEIDQDGMLTGIYNGSGLNLQYAGAIGRTHDGRLQACWLGNLATGSRGALHWQEVSAPDLYRQWSPYNLFSSSDQLAREIWTKQFGPETSQVSLTELAAIPALSREWKYLSPIVQRATINSEQPDRISFPQFQECYSLLPREEAIQIGRLFEAIQSPELAPGESRLIGSTAQPLGRTRLIPEATRINRQSLILVHLSRPGLPPAVGDSNTYTDFNSSSDSDWKQPED